MKRRANHEGSIRPLKSGKWQGRITVDGGRLAFTAERKEDVAAWLRKMSGQAEQGLTYKGAQTTTGEYLTSWLASKKSSVRPYTYDGYRNIIEKYLIPAFGTILIKDLTADRIQATYDHWGNSVGDYTCIKAHMVLNMVLGRARTTGLITRNPCESVSSTRAPHQEMQFWTEDEANRFLATAQNDRFFALFHLAIVTGARQGELLGLKWEDVDFGRGTVRFRRQITRTGTFAAIKTRSGNRTLELGEQNLNVLRDHYQLQQTERLIAGDKWQETGLVFGTIIGTHVNHKNLLDRHFFPLITAAGLPRIRFHDLRHTAVAIMLGQGIPIYTVSKWLGHARASITSDIYGHLVPGAFNGIGEMMHNLITPVKVDLKTGHKLGTE